jgi:peptidoglycan/LPS O-acetylase OafA/YrhL
MNANEGPSGERLFNRNYPELDLLRSVAIILVMLVHCVRRVEILPSDSWLGQFASWGWNGVGLFFVLSGFLIGGQIIEATQRGVFSFKRFYIKRFWRIFPPYYFSLLVVTGLFLAGLADNNVVGLRTGTQEFLTDLTYHILYLQNYLSWHKIQGALYFSLAIEEQFYILIPFVLFFLLRYQRGWFLAAIAALILTGVFIRFALYDPLITSAGAWNLGIRFPFHTRFDSLLSGVLAAWLFIRYNNVLRRIPAAFRALLFISSAVAIGVCIVYGGDSNSYFNTCWQFIFTNFGFSVLILLMVTGSFSKYIRGSVHLFFAHIARLSYTMYLYHLILLFPVVKLLRKFYPISWGSSKVLAFLIFFGIYFLSVVVLSSIVYRLIDAPSMKYRAKILSRMDGMK